MATLAIVYKTLCNKRKALIVVRSFDDTKNYRIARFRTFRMMTLQLKAFFTLFTIMMMKWLIDIAINFTFHEQFNFCTT